MRQSLDSSRPIMAPSVASNRVSQYSMAPSVQTTSSQDSAHAEIHYITKAFDKLDDKKLASQRFVPSAEKSESLSKLALGAKLERALDRRFSGQDAVMRTKKAAPQPTISEKPLMVKTEKIAAN